MERSRSNNLLQVADYVAGIVNRAACQKPGAEGYRPVIAAHEITRRR